MDSQYYTQILEKKKQFYTTVFLEIFQAFYQVWHDSLLYTLKKSVPVPYFLLITVYMTNRSFIACINTIIPTQLVIQLLKQKSLEEMTSLRSYNTQFSLMISLRHSILL